MPKFRVRFDTMLLCKMCLSISIWMPTKICLYTYYYIPFLNDQSFHHWQNFVNQIDERNRFPHQICLSHHRVHPITTLLLRVAVYCYFFLCVQHMADAIHTTDQTGKNFYHVTQFHLITVNHICFRYISGHIDNKKSI